jgi:TonB family protein
MRSLVFVLALASGLSPVGALVLRAEPSLARPALPVNPPTDWVGADDYPQAAWRAKVTGVVAFDLTVGTDGTPVDCAISQSSGNADLDMGTCALLMRRARFVAARDDRGTPALGHYHNSVRWVLPQHFDPHFDAGPSRLEYDVDRDGVVDHCRMEPHPLPGVLDMCHILGYVVPYRDAAGRRVRKHVTMTIDVTVIDKP